MNSKLVDTVTAIAIQKCRNCKHSWVEILGERTRCLLCDSQDLERPILVREVRAAYDQTTAREVNRRSALRRILAQHVPEVYERAREVLEKASEVYAQGIASDRVLQRLQFCYLCFRDLGLPESAIDTAGLLGVAYAKRAEDQEIASEADLRDFGSSLQWFSLAQQREWVAVINIRLGIKSSLAVTADTREYHRLLQLSRRHLELARAFYLGADLEKVDEIDRHLENVVRLLQGATIGSGLVEGASIQAAAVENAGAGIEERIADGTTYIGLSIRQAGVQVAGAIDAHGSALSEAIREQGQGIQSSLREVARDVSRSLDSINMTTAAGLGYVGSTLVRVGRKTEVGLEKLRTDLQAGFSRTGKELDALGSKAAISMLAGGALGGILTGGAINNLGANIVQRVADQGLPSFPLPG